MIAWLINWLLTVGLFLSAVLMVLHLTGRLTAGWAVIMAPVWAPLAAAIVLAMAAGVVRARRDAESRKRIKNGGTL